MKKFFRKKIILIALVACVLALSMTLCACSLFRQKLEVSYTGGDVVVGGELDFTKLSVKMVDGLGSHTLTEGDYLLSGFDSSTAGTKTVTVTYRNLTATFTVEVVAPSNALTSIEVTYMGGDIFVGGSLNRAKISVTAFYADNTERKVTSWTLSGFDSATAGAKSVTVSYTENGVTKTDDFTVDVVKVELQSISVVYAGEDVFVGDELDETFITVTATYTDGSSKTVDGWTCSGFDGSQSGVNTVTVTYTEDGVTKTDVFTVTVLSAPPTEIRAEYTGGEIFVSDEIDPSNVTVTAVTSDGSEEVVTDFTLSPRSFDETGVKTVTVSYTVKGDTLTATFTVEVKALVPDRMDAVYNGLPIALNAQPDKNDFVVTVTYTNGKQADVTDFTLDEADTSAAGVVTFTLHYSENGVDLQTEVAVTVNDVTVPSEPKEGEYNVNVIKEEDLSIHFLMLGNKNTGDSVYIKAGDTDILIDAGSRENSANTISDYIDQYCTDGILEYVVATHAHQDHISAFYGSSSSPGIFDRYVCNVIIDFAKSGNSLYTDSGNPTVYNKYLAARDAEIEAGAKHYTANDCVNNANGAQKEYTLADGITMEILDQRYYRDSTDNENNYSVCLMIKQGDNNYLFTGDLEDDGEESLVNLNPDLPKVKLWKGGHHGSYTAGNETLMAKIQPETICICTCFGTTEYTSNVEKVFPATPFIERIAPYTDRVYCTSDGSQYKTNSACIPANGNIVFACTNGQITMYFSNNNLKLKDTEWFKNNRTMPDAWK